MIAIDIKYKLSGGAKWRIIHIPPEDYFMEDKEPFELDSVPVYDHAIEYLDDRLSDADKYTVSSTQIRIIDDVDNSITITENFWNRQRNRVIERIDTGKSSYSEIILDLQISDDPVKHEIIRLPRQHGCLMPTYHGIITDNPDGSQCERKIPLCPAQPG